MAAGTDNFVNNQTLLNSPAHNGYAVTPSDANELPIYSRYLYVGGAGNVTAVLAGDSEATGAITFTAVPVGTVLPVRAKMVKATGTTATLIVALY